MNLMETDPSTIELLLGQLTTIRWLLAAILAMLIIGSGGTIAAVLYVARLVRNAGEQHELDLFRDQAEELLAADKLDELVNFSTNKLRTHPRHTFGHWYLAVAYFHQGKLHHAKREFEKVRDLEPGWGPDYVEPYMDELQQRIREATPKLVRD